MQKRFLLEVIKEEDEEDPTEVEDEETQAEALEEARKGEAEADRLTSCVTHATSRVICLKIVQTFKERAGPAMSVERGGI